MQTNFVFVPDFGWLKAVGGSSTIFRRFQKNRFFAICAVIAQNLR